MSIVCISLYRVQRLRRCRVVNHEGLAQVGSKLEDRKQKGAYVVTARAPFRDLYGALSVLKYSVEMGRKQVIGKTGNT